jgi:hypothetical protein
LDLILDPPSSPSTRPRNLPSLERGFNQEIHTALLASNRSFSVSWSQRPAFKVLTNRQFFPWETLRPVRVFLRPSVPSGESARRVMSLVSSRLAGCRRSNSQLSQICTSLSQLSSEAPTMLMATRNSAVPREERVGTGKLPDIQKAISWWRTRRFGPGKRQAICVWCRPTVFAS